MAKMTKPMQELFNKVPIAILATATPDGIPNAVPIGAKRIIDNQTVLVSDQFFNKTLANMKANPRVSLMYWEGNEGYQIKGPVTLETTGRRFKETARWIEEMSEKMGLSFRSKGAVILQVEEIYAIGPRPDAGKRLA
jgi:predicted pyridoxine 5'-phosphate oxidase superfamily flavin-nucleotide-binding protein